MNEIKQKAVDFLRAYEMDHLDVDFESNLEMFYPSGENPVSNACKKGEGGDAKLLYMFAARLVERAAKLTAINLSAIAIKTGQGADPTRPICIVAEGVFIW